MGASVEASILVIFSGIGSEGDVVFAVTIKLYISVIVGRSNSVNVCLQVVDILYIYIYIYIYIYVICATLVLYI